MPLISEKFKTIYAMWIKRISWEYAETYNFITILYDLLEANRNFLDIALKQNKSLIVIVGKTQFLPEDNYLVKIFNRALLRSGLSVTAFPFCLAMVIDQNANLYMNDACRVSLIKDNSVLSTDELLQCVYKWSEEIIKNSRQEMISKKTNLSIALFYNDVDTDRIYHWWSEQLLAINVKYSMFLIHLHNLLKFNHLVLNTVFHESKRLEVRIGKHAFEPSDHILAKIFNLALYFSTIRIEDFPPELSMIYLSNADNFVDHSISDVTRLNASPDLSGRHIKTLLQTEDKSFKRTYSGVLATDSPILNPQSDDSPAKAMDNIMHIKKSTTSDSSFRRK